MSESPQIAALALSEPLLPRQDRARGYSFTPYLQPEPGPPRLVLLDRQGPRARFVLQADRTTLGRHSDCDVQLLDQEVRGRHAVILWEEPRWTLLLGERDALARTALNGAPPPGPSAPLFDGDVLRLGTTSLQFFAGQGSFRLKQRDATRRLPRQFRPTLSGDLRSVRFAEVVQLLSLGEKTGQLTVAIAGQVCWRLLLQDGAPVHAAGAGTIAPLEAFQAMARLEAGRFEFFEGPVPEVVTLRGSTQALLLDAMRIADEHRNRAA